jgi:hypothetical protein
MDDARREIIFVAGGPSLSIKIFQACTGIIGA